MFGMPVNEQRMEEKRGDGGGGEIGVFAFAD
jgi:hypothetical protein